MIDELVTQLHTVDIEFLANKCRTLMASNVHNIKLFTDSFIKKLFKCSHPNLLKIYLLPFITWLDSTIFTELAMAYNEIDVMKFCKFTNIIDDTKPITSYPIPSFSQLIIPLDDSEYTIVAIKMFLNYNSELILKDVVDIKVLLKSHWELTDHALRLVAIDYHYNCMYWMIPKQVQHLVENRLKLEQDELQNKGIYQIILLPNSFYSTYNDFDQQVINNPFNVLYKVSLRDSVKVCT